MGQLEVTRHGELALADGCFVRITPGRTIHTYDLGMSLGSVLRNPSPPPAAPPSGDGYVPPMSWVEIEDAALGRVVVELQPTVLEVFRARVHETTRIHLRMLGIEQLGPDAQGNNQVRIGVPGGAPGLLLTVPEQWWVRLWPLLEQARSQQYQFMGY